MDFAKQQLWNNLAPLSDQSGGVVPGTAIRTSQEVVYEKVVS